MTMRRERIGRTLREVVLTLGAVLGVIAIVIAIGAVAFGLRPLVFRSGSMAPTIDTGDLALAHEVDADSLRVGQIVSVPTEGGERVTHRIVQVQHEAGGVAVLHLRGDANRVDDAETYSVTHADKVLFSVPKLGYVVSWLSGSIGRFLLGLYAAFLLMTIFRRSPRDGAAEDSDTPPAAERSARSAAVRGSAGVGTIGTAVLVTVGLTAGVLATAHVTGTFAHFTDSANVNGVTFSTYTVPAPVLTCNATNGAATANVTWPAVSGSPPPLTYTGAVSGITTSSTTGPSLASGTYTYSFSWATNGSTNKNKSATITITAKLTNSPTWVTTAAKTLTTGSSSTVTGCA